MATTVALRILIRIPSTSSASSTGVAPSDLFRSCDTFGRNPRPSPGWQTTNDSSRGRARATSGRSPSSSSAIASRCCATSRGAFRPSWPRTPCRRRCCPRTARCWPARAPPTCARGCRRSRGGARSTRRGASATRCRWTPRSPPRPRSEPEARAIQANELGRVVAAFAELPERQRAALRLSALEGRSLEEIGDALDVAPDTAKSLVARSRRTLSHRLAAAELGCDDGARADGGLRRARACG